MAGALMEQRRLEPKRKAADYPASARGEGFEIGALVYTLQAGKDSFFVPDYLIVEVAVFPAKGEALDLSAGHFWTPSTPSLHFSNKAGRQIVPCSERSKPLVPS